MFLLLEPPVFFQGIVLYGYYLGFGYNSIFFIFVFSVDKVVAYVYNGLRRACWHYFFFLS
tara:strand:- start:18794 stop:18973 length:180 start_codon:yes stop_codon:yes gene_type:complete